MRRGMVLVFCGMATLAAAARSTETHRPTTMLSRSPSGMPPEDRIKPLTARLQYPRPVFTQLPTRAPKGTTVDIPPPRVPPILTVVGIENLAAGKPVTASFRPRQGELAQITDGNKEAEPGAAVELGTGTRAVVIDLGKPSAIAGIVIWHEHADPRVYHGVVVQVAADEKFRQDVVTLFNNDATGESGFGRGLDHEYFEYYAGQVVAGRGVTARYVRVASRGNTVDAMNRLTEVEVWGRSLE